MPILSVQRQRGVFQRACLSCSRVSSATSHRLSSTRPAAERGEGCAEAGFVGSAAAAEAACCVRPLLAAGFAIQTAQIWSAVTGDANTQPVLMIDKHGL